MYHFASPKTGIRAATSPARERGARGKGKIASRGWMGAKGTGAAKIRKGLNPGGKARRAALDERYEVKILNPSGRETMRNY